MACLQAADILLPAEGIDRETWAVIACDQFTSQPEYWEQVRRQVGEAPSALHMIYPEVYLEGDNRETYESRIRRIQEQMEAYLADGRLTERVRNGYVLTVRETGAGLRIGLIAAIDLEAYDYSPDAKSLIRATEATVQSRIPVRVGIRKNAPVEMPHVMMLFDDRRCLLESLYERREELPRLYDTRLMFGGGRVSGYALEGDWAESVTASLEQMEAEAGEVFLAAGDGNHSLAAAKACWELRREGLTEQERQTHPARYALAEIVNLYSQSLIFHPIHRVLFGEEPEILRGEFLTWMKKRGIGFRETDGGEAADMTFLLDEQAAGILLPDCKLPVRVLQEFLDEYIDLHPGLKLDYVHSREAVARLADAEKTCGILLRGIDKEMLFPSIAAGGVMPRKTFSIGEDCEKRYYMECRKLSLP